VGKNVLYEFAEGEPGVVTPLNVLPITFICDRCGYTAEFDAELFNPSFLARLQGADAERVEELQADEFRVIVPMSGSERTDTVLDIASALCGARDGEIIVMNVSSEPTTTPHLIELIEKYHPPRGAPAPVHLIHERDSDIGSAIAQTARREKCDVLIMGWRGWTRSERAVIGTVIDPVLRESLCDVILVNDHGLPQKVERILLLTSGGPNARIAAPFGVDMAKSFEAKLHVLSVVTPQTPDPEVTGEGHIDKTLAPLAFTDLKYVEREVQISPEPLQTIIQEAQRYDLLLIGAAPRSWRGEIRVDSFVAKVTRNVGITSLVVRGRQTVLESMFTRFLTRR
jgi:nucleotide-binding universal stress UspA family protein